jgi:Ca2+-binding EF-hand superfamily protein
MTMRSFLIACAGALALGGGVALAQDITSGHLDAMDADDDGAIDATEFAAFMTQAFTTMDANGDGYVTEVEGASYMSPEQFAAANSNGDDGVSQAEFLAASQADFQTADQDGDGVLN